jgi:hypothetical protein
MNGKKIRNKTLSMSSIIEQIQSIDTSGITWVRFFPKGGASYSISLDSIKKIAVYIEKKYSRKSFQAEELIMEKDYCIKNFKSNLSPEDYSLLLNTLNDWVEQGWSFEIIHNREELKKDSPTSQREPATHYNSGTHKKISTIFLWVGYLLSLWTLVEYADFLVWKNPLLLWYIFFLGIYIGIFILLLLVFFFVEIVWVQKKFLKKEWLFSNWEIALHLIFTGIRIPYYAGWGYFLFEMIDTHSIGSNTALAITLAIFLVSLCLDLILLSPRTNKNEVKVSGKYSLHTSQYWKMFIFLIIALSLILWLKYGIIYLPSESQGGEVIAWRYHQKTFIDIEKTGVTWYRDPVNRTIAEPGDTIFGIGVTLEQSEFAYQYNQAAHIMIWDRIEKVWWWIYTFDSPLKSGEKIVITLVDRVTFKPLTSLSWKRFSKTIIVP